MLDFLLENDYYYSHHLTACNLTLFIINIMQILLSALICLFFLTNNSLADEKPVFTVVIKDHQFVPQTLDVPAGEKFKLIVDNQDSTPEEFESHDFHREKIIGGNSKATIFVGPLEAGEYNYFGEFNPETAQGKLVAK